MRLALLVAPRLSWVFVLMDLEIKHERALNFISRNLTTLRPVPHVVKSSEPSAKLHLARRGDDARRRTTLEAARTTLEDARTTLEATRRSCDNGM